jgi:hypothetical protein
MAVAGAHVIGHQPLHAEFPGDAVLVQEEIHHDAGGHQQVREEHQQHG